MSTTPYRTNRLKTLLGDIWATSRSWSSLASGIQITIQAHGPPDTQEQADIIDVYRFCADNPQFEGAPVRIEHCVRCHALYRAGDTSDGCVIPHAIDSTVDNVINLGGQQWQFRSKCCNAVTLVGDLVGDSFIFGRRRALDYCFVGTHTVAYAEVQEYWRRRNWQVWYANIWPCMYVDGVRGCARPNFRGDPGKLAFDTDFMGPAPSGFSRHRPARLEYSAPAIPS
jgi:hypothetical protein